MFPEPRGDLKRLAVNWNRNRHYQACTRVIRAGFFYEPILNQVIRPVGPMMNVPHVFGFLARGWIDIALAIHFYEAVLATLAILVWHFYHVIFDPDVYPVNFAFIDGRISEELYKEEHELAFEQIRNHRKHGEVSKQE